MRSAFLTATLLALFAGSAAAVPIDVSQQADYDADGQRIDFTFSSLAPSDGTGGTLTIAAPASDASFPGIDAVGTGQDDWFALEIEGDGFGSYSCDGNSGTTVIPGATINGGADCVFSLDVALGGGALDGYLADGSIVVSFISNSAMNAFPDEDDIVTARLRYTAAEVVPLPAPAVLLLGALGGLAALRARRRG